MIFVWMKMLADFSFQSGLQRKMENAYESESEHLQDADLALPIAVSQQKDELQLRQTITINWSRHSRESTYCHSPCSPSKWLPSKSTLKTEFQKLNVTDFE